MVTRLALFAEEMLSSWEGPKSKNRKTKKNKKNKNEKTKNKKCGGDADMLAMTCSICTMTFHDQCAARADFVGYLRAAEAANLLALPHVADIPEPFKADVVLCVICKRAARLCSTLGPWG